MAKANNGEPSQYEETVQRGADEVARLVRGKGRRYATPDEVLDDAANLSNEQLFCKTARHHHFSVPRTAYHNKRYRYIYVELECSGGCGVIQRYEMNERGRIYWGPYLNYSEAKGYLSHHGVIVGEARDALRVEMMRRVIRPSITRKDQEPHRNWEE